MGVTRHIRAVATGLLVLAGTAAVCPEAAHGSRAHENVDVGEPHSGEHHDHESGGHDHSHCEYEVAHTHTVRLSCAPDELASHLEAGFAHGGMRIPEPRRFWIRMPDTGRDSWPDQASRLDSVRLLL